jgi:hypothetical protein
MVVLKLLLLLLSSWVDFGKSFFLHEWYFKLCGSDGWAKLV